VLAAVLICDGNPQDRSALRDALDGFDITESAPAGARDVLATQRFDAVIADELELMQHVQVTYPVTLRFLISGDRELETLARAVNNGAAHRFFQKPWDRAKLRNALDADLRARVEVG